MSYMTVLALVSTFWVASEIILGRLRRSEAGSQEHDKSSLRLLWFTIVIGVTAGVLLATFRIGRFGHGYRYAALYGLGLILAGLVIRWAAILTLWKYFTVDVSVAKDQKLIDTGLYRFVRHPSYTGSLISFLGLGLALANWLSLLIIFVPITAAFLYRIKVEEKALAAFFGDPYMRYCASTKRLIPMIY